MVTVPVNDRAVKKPLYPAVKGNVRFSRMVGSEVGGLVSAVTVGDDALTVGDEDTEGDGVITFPGVVVTNGLNIGEKRNETTTRIRRPIRTFVIVETCGL